MRSSVQADRSTATALELLESLCAAPDDPRPVPGTLLVVAHPDDEVLGAGGRLQRLRASAILHVTDGAPRDESDACALGFRSARDYAIARRQELYAALALAGIEPGQTRELGIPDQKASFHLADLVRRLAGIFDDIAPDIVLTHPYEGGHPDHDATAFGVHAAVALIGRDGGRAPAVVEFTSYHNRGGQIGTGLFLPGTGETEEVVVELDPVQQDLKRRMLACFATQQGTLQYFSADIERFRLGPQYDFTAPAHAGTLFYELFPWGMTGERFRQLAREAMDELGLCGPI